MILIEASHYAYEGHGWMAAWEKVGAFPSKKQLPILPLVHHSIL